MSASSSATQPETWSRENFFGSSFWTLCARMRVARNSMSSCFSSKASPSAAASISSSLLTLAGYHMRISLTTIQNDSLGTRCSIAGLVEVLNSSILISCHGPHSVASLGRRSLSRRVFRIASMREASLANKGCERPPFSLLHWHDQVFHDVILSLRGVLAHVKAQDARRLRLGRIFYLT